MAGVKITIQDKEFNKLVAGMQKKSEDLSQPFKVISEIMRSSVLKNFAVEGRSRPRQWKKSKRAARQSGKTLSDTGVLRNSINTFKAKTFAGVKTNLEYAAIHNFGGFVKPKIVRPKKSSVLAFLVDGQKAFSQGHKIPGFKMPKREFMVIQDEDKKDAMFEIEKHILRAAR